MDNSLFLIILGAIYSLCGIIFGYGAYRQSQNKESKENGRLISDIKYIKQGIDDLKKQQSKTEERYISLFGRLTTAEGCIKEIRQRLEEHLRGEI